MILFLLHVFCHYFKTQLSVLNSVKDLKIGNIKLNMNATLTAFKIANSGIPETSPEKRLSNSAVRLCKPNKSFECERFRYQREIS